jgi:hypothetical protein
VQVLTVELATEIKSEDTTQIVKVANAIITVNIDFLIDLQELCRSFPVLPTIEKVFKEEVQAAETAKISSKPKVVTEIKLEKQMMVVVKVDSSDPIVAILPFCDISI